MKDIIEATKDFIDEYDFDNRNLRGSYKKEIWYYIKDNYIKYVNYICHNELISKRRKETIRNKLE
ncbi:MAG: hypothetical protein PUB18_02240 [bacterium]|nr:hypothetical protein [bacterium]